MKTYTVEEIREAVNIVIGDDGRRSDEVIDVLETDVEQNTKDYLNRKVEEEEDPSRKPQAASMRHFGNIILV